MQVRVDGVLKAFDSVIAAIGLDAKYRYNAPHDWAKVSEVVDYLPVNYSESSIDYHASYWLGKDEKFSDLSLVLYYDKQAVGVWPISVIDRPQMHFGSCGGLLHPPLFDRGLAIKSIKKVVAACLSLADDFCRIYSLPTWESREYFSGKNGLSEWHIQAMQRGANASVRHDIFIDLSLDIATIKNRFRKSYKSLITSGKQHFQCAILNQKNGDEEIWQEFQALHLLASGRSTRSKESWQLQYQSLLKGHFFLVFLRDHNGRMVGGALFHTTRDEGYYSVGAYDRGLFDKPIGHVIQFRAIEEMKKLGLRWYFIGARPFPDESPKLSEKQAAIVQFQNGFATHTFPRFLITRKLVPSSF